MSSEENIKIKCNDDGVEMTIPRKSIKLMGTIEDFLKMAEENSFAANDDPFPVEMSSEWFKKVNDFCQYHAENPGLYDNTENKDPTFMCDFDKDYIEKFMDIEKNHVDLLELYRLAHYLHIPELRKLISKKLVTMIYNASCPNDIRKLFGLEPKEDGEDGEDGEKTAENKQ